MNKYLIDEPTLVVLPTLARKIGLNEAILLQQIHYWLRSSRHVQDGHRWIYNTYADWLSQLPYLTLITLRRTIQGLESQGIVISTIEFNTGVNKTKWYRIDYQKLQSKTGLPAHSGLLIDEYPLIFQPSLAAALGLNEAIFLQQLQYWLTQSEKYRDDKAWIAKSREKWLSEFPFWSLSTFKRIVKSLTDKGIIYNTEQYNEDKTTQTRWFAICYDKIPAKFMGFEEIKAAQCEHSEVQKEQTEVHIEQSEVHIEQYGGSKGAEPRFILSSSSIYTETDPETITETDRSSEINDTDKNTIVEKSNDFVVKVGESASSAEELSTDVEKSSADKGQKSILRGDGGEKKVNGREEVDPPLKNEISALLHKAISYYTELVVGAKAPERKVKRYSDMVEKAVFEHGIDVIDKIFDEVKRSDYLLGFHDFKFTFPWYIKNAEKILSGEYKTFKGSKYDKAQTCNAESRTCRPTTETKQPDEMCRYCIRWQNRTAPEQEKARTPQEIADDCHKAFQKLPTPQRRKLHCPVEGGRTAHDFCKLCPMKKADKAAEFHEEAAKCFERCSGMCGVKILSHPAFDYCAYCPGNTPPKPRGKKSKKSPEGSVQATTGIISADRNDSGDIWAKAFQWFQDKKKTVSGYLRKYMPFTTYTEEDLLDEALTVAYETLMPMIAAHDSVRKSVFESHFWMNLDHRLTRMQTIPAVCDVMGDSGRDNKSACVFYEINTENNDFAEYDSLKAEPSVIEDIHETEFKEILLSVLPLTEEEILKYQLGLTDRGKLSIVEIALILGYSKQNISKKRKSAMQILERFVKKYKITPATKPDDLRKFAEEFSKEIFKPVSAYKIFELGNLLKTG